MPRELIQARKSVFSMQSAIIALSETTRCCCSSAPVGATDVYVHRSSVLLAAAWDCLLGALSPCREGENSRSAQLSRSSALLRSPTVGGQSARIGGKLRRRPALAMRAREHVDERKVFDHVGRRRGVQSPARSRTARRAAPESDRDSASAATVGHHPQSAQDVQSRRVQQLHRGRELRCLI